MLHRKRIWFVAPLALLALGAGVALHVPSWHELAGHEALLHRQVAEAPVLAALAYVLAYAAAVALSVPAGAALSAIGGLLFGAALGTVLATIAATAGAVALFLMARGLLRPVLERRAASVLARLGPHLRHGDFHTLLALRLLPMVPFWLMNLAPAVVGVRLRPFVAATFLGTIPATVVFASMGAGLSGVMATGRRPDFMVLFSPDVLLPLTGLALLAALPAALRRRPAAPAATLAND